MHQWEGNPSNLSCRRCLSTHAGNNIIDIVTINYLAWFCSRFSQIVLSFIVPTFPGGSTARLESLAQLKPPNFCPGERPSLFCGHQPQPVIFVVVTKCNFDLQVLINLIHINPAIMDRRVKTSDMAGAKKNCWEKKKCQGLKTGGKRARYSWSENLL